MGRSRNGQAVPAGRLTPESLAALEALRDEARAGGDLAEADALVEDHVGHDAVEDLHETVGVE